MFIYKIELNKNFWNLKVKPLWDINLGGMFVANSAKECRELAQAEFSEIGGDEMHFEIDNVKRARNGKYNWILKVDMNNEIWKKSKYTSCRKIGTAFKRCKKGVLMVSQRQG